MTPTRTVPTYLFTACFLAALACSGTAHAVVTDHASQIKGPITSGPEATRVCLSCHPDAASEVMRTTHWTWSAPQEIAGRGQVDRGKKNAINNFCVSINGNWPRCTSCHVGYGWKDANFDFGDASRVDCLVCHDTTGTYRKKPTAAGNPTEDVDLVFVAQNVGTPSRQTCGACHFFGGGGDAVKHGDLDSSMVTPSADIDVHMAADGLDFSCQECHSTDAHAVSGKAMVVSPAGEQGIGCSDCHDPRPHSESLLDDHLDRVACQTCHIPSFAKEVATKTSWDWSTAGQDRTVEKDANGRPTYAKKKGTFTWGKNITPTYAWYNGSAGAYLNGDRIDPTQVTKLSYPLGSIDDPAAKIFPFKVHPGRQPYDAEENILVTPHLFGKGGYWKTYDWDQAAASGMAASGLPYSGELGFTDTVMYWAINHMVAPADQALGCLDCHGDQGRLDWQALGYARDPLRGGATP